MKNDTLKNILRDLKNGYSYGKDFTWNYCENKPISYPFFSAALYITPKGNIGYEHFGSSAIKPTLNDLEWLITTIFRTTPEGFLHDYIRNDKSERAE